MEHTYEDFRELIRHCLDDAVEAGHISMDQIDAYDKLIDMDKDLQEISMNDQIGDYYEDEYSRNSYRGNSYRMNGNGDRGGNYSNSGGYSRRGGSYNRGGSYRGYSRDAERDHMMEKMERMMEEASSETERQAIQKIMDTI